MPYSPEEYEALKAAYKKDLRERKAWLEKMRWTTLRRRAEWHLHQVKRSLAELGLEESQPLPTDQATGVPNLPQPDLPSQTSSVEDPTTQEKSNKTLF